MKQSSYIAFYFFKVAGIGFCIMGLILLYAIVFSDVSDVITAIVVMPIAFAVAYFMFFRMRVIRYNHDIVEILNGSESIRTSWSNVRSVSKLFCCAPPLYRMTFRDNTRPAYFIMSMFFYVYVIFWAWDFTGFYQFAKARIAETRTT